MKYLFWMLIVMAFTAMITMRIKQKQFEVASGKQFNIMHFELPKGKTNLNQLLTDWKVEPEKHFILTQLSIDYIFMSTLFPAILSLCFWVT
ncbi:MAG: hypothetical protein IPO92_00820 [Saprospiraceae bacterium]|nr:hypothetical protein [Saprospiraceae bacterium]